MFYTPHILQLRINKPFDKDEFGRSIPGTGAEEWKTIGHCRCDDNTTKEFVSENGKVYRPNYHVVCEGKPDIKGGDYCRCLDGETVRGEGEVYIPKRMNYFNYSEIWM